MVALRSFIENYISLSNEDWSVIDSKFEKKVYPRNHNILQAGNVCHHLMFLEKGLLRYFTIKEGLEVNKFFTIAPYLFTSQNSYFQRKESKEYIQTIEPSIVWQITYDQNQALLELPSWNKFARKLTQEVQYFTECILEDLQSESAESRYKRIMTNHPEYLKRIPLKHLASFLGIAPQSLSRIRKKVMLTQ